MLGIPWEIDSDGLKDYMSKFGDLEDCIVMKVCHFDFLFNHDHHLNMVLMFRIDQPEDLVDLDTSLLLHLKMLRLKLT